MAEITHRRPGRLPLLLIVLGGLMLLGLYTWAFWAIFSSRAPGANDFFSRWAGAYLYFRHGWNPYGLETSLWIQNIIYGGPARPDQDPSLFAYPFYTIFVVAPYTLFSDYSWAQAAWQVTCQVILLATLFVLLRYFRWRPKAPMLGALALWMIVFYPAARSIILGQLALAVHLATLIVFWLLFRAEASPQGDALAGALLALTTIKPQMQFLLIPFLLIWAFKHRRWAFIGAAAGAMALLLGISFLLLPTWLTEWLAQVRLYPSYTPPAVLYILTREVIPLGEPLGLLAERGLALVLISYLLYVWWQVLHTESEARLDWALALTLVITHMVVLRTATTHFVVFTFALIPLFRDWARGRPWLTYAVMLALAVGMWALFLLSIQGNQEANIVHVPLPLITLGLVLTQHGDRLHHPR